MEGNRDLKAKVSEMVKAVENPHTAFANFLGSMHPFIHPDLWDEYLQHSFETLMKYVRQSNHPRRAQQDYTGQQTMPQQSHQRSYTQLQPIQQSHGPAPTMQMGIIAAAAFNRTVSTLVPLDIRMFPRLLMDYQSYSCHQIQ